MKKIIAIIVVIFVSLLITTSGCLDSKNDNEKEEIFRDLQVLRNVGLVEPIEAEHMYYAAISSKACGLTTLGKYYWRLVSQQKI